MVIAPVGACNIPAGGGGAGTGGGAILLPSGGGGHGGGGGGVGTIGGAGGGGIGSLMWTGLIGAEFEVALRSSSARPATEKETCRFI